ncbi:hypothetical protein [Halorhodospira halochloris]|uniref:hypothetical protein n=1 Tax=Halorhodospira halochloris TaxID=1052 RepID=UPI001EE8D560|nr:hypothetical protein [Halorhodospira halochloris]MCG5547532.1 hypothetical protein [Halorhodospira halochloris]
MHLRGIKGGVIAAILGAAYAPLLLQASAVCTDEELQRLIEAGTPQEEIEEQCQQAPSEYIPSEIARQEPAHPFSGFDIYHAIGAGAYVMSANTDAHEHGFTGNNVLYRGAFHDNWAVDIGYHEMTHDDWSDIEVSGVDTNLWLGTNMRNEGWNLSVGVGYFSEDWDGESYEQMDLSGMIDYRWRSLVFEARIFGREFEEDTEVLGTRINILYQFGD